MERTYSNSRAFMVYLCYIIAYVFPPVSIYGVYVAYNDLKYCTDEVEVSHFKSQIRIFWISLAIWFISPLIAFFLPLIATLIGMGWIAWSLYKVIKGVYKINRNQAV